MRSFYIEPKEFSLLISLMNYGNFLIMRVCLDTGLRISDVLCFEKRKLLQKSFVVTEMKTGKKRKIRLKAKLKAELLRFCSCNGSAFVFRHRTNPKKHKTRQAVWYDIKRACSLLGIKKNITPHSARKIFAVELGKLGYDLEAVRQLLNHDQEGTTMFYLFAEEFQNTKKPRRRRRG